MTRLALRRAGVQRVRQVGTIREVSAGGSIPNAITASSPGDTVLLHAGSYPKLFIATAFSSPGVTIRAGHGEQVTIAGIHFSGATSSWFTFRGIKIETGAFVDDNDAAIRFVNKATDVLFEECTISNSRHGLRDDVIISLSPERLTLRRCDIYGHFVDNLQFRRGIDVTVEDCWSHDVTVDTTAGLHNDGIQIIGGTNYKVRRNRIFCKTLTVASSYPNQAIIAGGDPDASDRKIDGLEIVSNLLHHWPGSGIILAGADNAKIVGNTTYDHGDTAGAQGLTISLNSDPVNLSNDNLQIANNVGEPMVVMSGASRPFTLEANNNFRTGGGGSNLVTSDPLFRDTRSYVPTQGIIANGYNGFSFTDIFNRSRDPVSPDRGCYESLGQYIDEVMADSPTAWWRMSEVVLSFMFEVSGWFPGVYKGAGGAIPRQGSPVANAFSVRFNGSTGYGEVPYNEELNTAPWTIETWAYPMGGAGTLRSVYSTQTGTTGVQLEATTGNVWAATIGDGAGAAATVVSSSATTLNTWHHLVLTYDGTDAKLYVNAGAPTTTTTVFSENTTQATRIGANAATTAANFFNGQIGDTILYPAALSAARVTEHFNSAANI